MKNRIHLLIVIAILLIGFVIGSFFDLEINQALFSKNNDFGLIMASFGVYPCYAGLAFIGGGLFSVSIKRKDLPLWGKVISCVLGSIAYALSVILCGREWPSVNGYNNPNLEVASYLISAFVFGGVFAFSFIICQKGDTKQLWRVFIIMTIIFTFALIPTAVIIKAIMHRPRYRYLVRTGALDFKNWWQSVSNYKDYIGLDIEGFAVTKEEFKSFPSGHSGTGMIMAMFLSYAPIFFKKLEGKETLLFYFGVAYGLLMMFSRMLVGAHYLTDTCLASLIVMVVFYIVNEFALKKNLFEPTIISE